MKKTSTLLATVFFLSMTQMAPAHAEEALSAAQKEAVKAVIDNYLKEHPEVVIEAIQAWQEKQAILEAKMKAQAIAEINEEAKNTRSPIWGNPNGKTTVIEFFDYNCPYCKRVFPSVKKLIEQDGDIKVVMKEFPVLGPNSEYAAKAALAAQKQGKYAEFHAAMMGQSSRLSPQGVDAAAKKVGMDLARMKKDMESPEVRQELENVRIWAERLGVNGTPAFVIGEHLVPGAIDAQRMQALVEVARKQRQ